METLLVLTYTAICIVIFKVFKVPLNKWTVPTAALGGVILVGSTVLIMNYNHPFTNLAREFFVTTPIVPGVGGIVTSVEIERNQVVEKGTVLFRIDPKPYEVIVRQNRRCWPAPGKACSNLNRRLLQREQLWSKSRQTATEL